jgi:AcrR family transcriptional regulator
LTYHYFSNKEQILDELLEQALEKGISTVRRAVEEAGSPCDRLHWLVSSWLQMLQERPELLMVLYQMHVDKTVHQRWQEAAQRMKCQHMELMRQLIIEGQEAGQIVDRDPDQLTLVLQSFIHGLTFMVIRDHVPNIPDAQLILRILQP